MNLTPKKAWTLAAGYIGLIYVGLYFTPFLSTFLKERELLVSFINYSYLLAGAFLFSILYFIFKIRKPESYGMIGVLLIFLIAAIIRMELSTDRLHFLEHGLVYILIYLALRFTNSGMQLVGRSIFLCFLVALGDEAIQGLLPNREAEWNDFWANVFAYYLAAGLVGIVEYFRPHYGKAG
ncbi:MAG: hypothetical protein A3F82_04860 [Deltaproteobacteria bacterium RIFCSPLOWO2_12_FULL_44_12]|nr:MAG: hypothetical protein A2712_05910 [Deltaproteobacteria bacterium RIFCSPHIGHO2_01_FULL_43_49]OGQ16666.1 MAG: hypothetical protein A3D22_07035 [Deltaproteobacteria bacterium RIFCSPHIGHO2_02_FULL_44_53]OGQ29804.1 MAG: hypothetical protein A3D98_09700 [Deltaproteobacteria bacterium RIFCSPHIGHO2_12_FULL_44_21]OGQ33094.1 MAG: hypothetical protein A2979_03680 [Deltaproteobacteria bacterium RIFCSPLOWO2_01_FULL_45_74]OGQ42189.1 MAG: hypothetical protein A3I70_05985 [Deltaproteobacteria bacterium 